MVRYGWVCTHRNLKHRCEHFYSNSLITFFCCCYSCCYSSRFSGVSFGCLSSRTDPTGERTGEPPPEGSQLAGRAFLKKRKEVVNLVIVFVLLNEYEYQK